MHNSDVNLGRSDMAIQLADEAERYISASMARVAGSEAPSMDRTMGEIDMAHKLKLIDYARRDVLVGQLREIVNERRSAIRQERHARIMKEIQP